MSQNGDKKLQTVQLAYDDNSEDTLRLHNQQQQQQKAGQEWDNWEQQPMLGGPRNVRIVSIENEQLLNKQNNEGGQQQPQQNGSTLENPLYKVGLKLNKKQANLLRNNGYQSAPNQDGFDDSQVYQRKPRSLCCKVTTGTAIVCLIILILGLAIGIPVSHSKGKLILPRDNQKGIPLVRGSQGQILTAQQLQQSGVSEVANDVCCPDRACEVGYPGQPVDGLYALRIQAFGQNATTNSTPSVLIGPGNVDVASDNIVSSNLKALFYPYYHDINTKEGQTTVFITYDPQSLLMEVSLQNQILTSKVNYTLDQKNGSSINGAQLRVCLRKQKTAVDNLSVFNFTVNGTMLGSYPSRAQGSCQEYYFSGRFYQGFNLSYVLDYGQTSNLGDSNNVDLEFFKYKYVNADVCAFTIGNVGNVKPNPSQGQNIISNQDAFQKSLQETVNNSVDELVQCSKMSGCIGIWDLDTCLKGNTSLSTATNDLNNQFGKALSDWNVTGCITVKQKAQKDAVAAEVCREACAANETVVGLRMTMELGPNCNQSIVTDDLYNFFSQYEQQNSATNFGGCEPLVKRVSFNNTNMAPRKGPVGKRSRALRLF